MDGNLWRTNLNLERHDATYPTAFQSNLPSPPHKSPQRRPHLLANLRSSGIDLDRGRHSGGKLNAVWNGVNADAHRYALREANPGEDRADRCHSLLVGLGIRDVDAARDAADTAANDLPVAHHADPGRIADVDPREIGLLEISVEPERIGVDDGDGVHPDIHVVAELGVERSKL